MIGQQVDRSAKADVATMNNHDRDRFQHSRQRLAVETAHPPETTRPSIRTVSSSALFAGGHEIGIDHGGSLYRLKITRQGKLILNK